MLPTIGSKELVAWLPTLLGLGAGDVVVHPEVAYPTYEVGARLAGATAGRVRRPRPRSVRSGSGWSGSTRRPTRPAGSCRSSTCARSSPGPASAARSWPPTSATSSCGWDADAGVGAASGRSAAATTRGLLAVHSLSKRSNLAGYRAGVRRRRPGAGARAARGAQARRDDGARPGAGGDGRRARRRRARRGAAGALPAPRGAAPGPDPAGFRIDHSERACTCGPPATRTAGTPSTGSPSSASWSRRATSTARPATGTCGSR